MIWSTSLNEGAMFFENELLKCFFSLLLQSKKMKLSPTISILTLSLLNIQTRPVMMMVEICHVSLINSIRTNSSLFLMVALLVLDRPFKTYLLAIINGAMIFESKL